jgi:hypothetical protein
MTVNFYNIQACPLKSLRAIQFQNGLSLADFLKAYRNEEPGEQAFEQGCCPQGFLS